MTRKSSRGRRLGIEGDPIDRNPARHDDVAVDSDAPPSEGDFALPLAGDDDTTDTGTINETLDVVSTDEGDTVAIGDEANVFGETNIAVDEQVQREDAGRRRARDGQARTAQY